MLIIEMNSCWKHSAGVRRSVSLPVWSVCSWVVNCVSVMSRRNGIIEFRPQFCFILALWNSEFNMHLFVLIKKLRLINKGSLIRFQCDLLQDWRSYTGNSTPPFFLPFFLQRRLICRWKTGQTSQAMLHVGNVPFFLFPKWAWSPLPAIPLGILKLLFFLVKKTSHRYR